MSINNRSNNTRRVSVLEYYDVFDVKFDPTQLLANDQLTSNVSNIIPNNIKNEHVTNPFRGFWNLNPNPNAIINGGLNSFADGNPNNTAEIVDHHKAPQAISQIDIADNGDIMCYPPNVSVPYWNKIIFRNFDYSVNPNGISNSNLQALLAEYQDIREETFPPYTIDAYTNYIPIPKEYWGQDDSQTNVWPAPYTGADYSDITGWQTMCSNGNYDNVPVFIKFDQYQSRSKCVFSKSDKLNTNHDVEFNFGYHHGQMSPIKLNISISANNPTTNITNNKIRYNINLNKSQIQTMFRSCYWSIEWICDVDSGN